MVLVCPFYSQAEPGEPNQPIRKDRMVGSFAVGWVQILQVRMHLWHLKCALPFAGLECSPD